MKAVVASFVLLALVLCFVILMTVLLPCEAERLSRASEELIGRTDEERTEGALALQEEWERSEFWFSLVTAHEEIDEATRELVHLVSTAKAKSDSEFQLAAASLAEHFAHIGRLNALSLDGIL